jgi:branched-chain amino acid transport system substrate-binding protein
MLDNKAVLVVIMVVLLGGGLVGGYYIGSLGAAPAAPGLTGTQTVVFLAPLTGALGTYGENSAEAAKYAETQINAWLTERGETWSFNLEVDDTATDPETALTKMETWHGQGVQLFIGPMSSGECTQLLSYADSNQLLMVSPSSTAISLMLPDDSLFRFCPDDTIQGPAIAALLEDEGITDVVATWRGDAWGEGLTDAAEAAYDGTFAEKVEYSPDTTEFTTEAESLRAAVQNLLDGGATTDEVGVLAVSFEEIIPYMQAADDHDVLKTVRWYGSDGTCLLSSLSDDEVAGPFADTVNYTNTLFAPGISAKHEDVKEHIEEELARTPDAYCYNTYDITWCLALALDLVDEYSATEVIKVLPGLVENYYGASGLFSLNANGDRAVSDYDLWAVDTVDGDVTWVKVGVYNSGLDMIVWE